ncbi:MAG: hypothetical protein J6D03_09935 [Clostridia bacterium]|nr:hypothetical protein [Clostridia bacterium]
MNKVIFSDEVERMKRNKKFLENAKKKKWNYNIMTFSTIYNPNTGKYYVKHMNWKTYITNEDNSLDTIEKAWNFIDAYIKDCAKPYGQRNIKFSLAPDEIYDRN